MNCILSDKIKTFLIEKIKKIDIITEKDDWQYIKSFQVNNKNWEHKFCHPNLGYIEIEEKDSQLFFNMNIVYFLRYATSKNNLELVKKLFTALMKHHGNPNAQYYSEDSETNLTYAIVEGNLEIIKFLVSNGVHVHNEFETNMIAALRSKNYDIATYFLEIDSKINQEVILNDYRIDKEMSSFLEKWNLQKELNQEITSNKETKSRLKI